MHLRRCWLQLASVPSKLQVRCHGTTHGKVSNLDPLQPVQSYISRSRDPCINLSIEHYLLQKSPPEAVILFLYVNRPSIILGRNQNPWLEVNLGLIQAGRTSTADAARPQSEPPGLGDVDLVRRRSGGGTVFHDEGNVNWTVISPSSTFTRDKHAEMVVRALRNLDVQRSRVNERHDIVLDQGVPPSPVVWGPEDDTHSTPWQADNPRSLKVSGSAYKLTRQRALHHGTALLNSPNLNIIPHYLHSPAKAFIKGRGVESVSSPVGNILLNNEDFIDEVQREFRCLYGGPSEAQLVGEECLGIEEVEKGWKELKSPEWTYLQTPQFTLSNKPEDIVSETAAPASLRPGTVRTRCVESGDKRANIFVQFHMDVKHGAAIDIRLELDGVTRQGAAALGHITEKHKLHEIQDWPLLFEQAGLVNKEAISMAQWVQKMLVGYQQDSSE